ncbi:short chain dehydrogenase [Phytophthora infestans]|uniref:Short chain dehydrogenase n=1 Tax=Phytophthora infestans TaxID=4787 RepID=A0A8S9U0J4_PHYIN|nr:short chain dehydrogenase [Phytophthora infestans]
MSAARRRERVNVVWKPAHLTGVLVLALTFVNASSVVYVVRVLLFLYFIMASLDLALTRYHLWNFESTTPELKRYALVTGASSGLGREMSYLLSEQKYSLVLAARTETVLERMRAEIELVNRPTEVLVCVCDLSTTGGINKLIKLVKDKELVIDILVNNAGACLTKDFIELKEKEIDELMTLDMLAMVKLTRAIVPQMVERKVGRVLNISSIAGAFAVPTAALYGSSKAFMTSFSQALSYELRSTGVTVTCVCPGPVNTNFSKTADLDKAVCMTLPGLAADAKDTAKKALDAMFNGEILVYDTWFAYLTANLVQSIIPGRLAAFCYGAGMHELKNIWQMAKR